MRVHSAKGTALGCSCENLRRIRAPCDTARPASRIPARPPRATCVNNPERSEISAVHRRGLLVAGFLVPFIGGGQAQAKNLAEELEEKKAAIAAQKQKLAYLLEQQKIAKKAEAAGKINEIEVRVDKIETQIQQQITADKATPRTSKAVPKLEQVAEEVQKAKANAKNQISRAEIIEEAKVAEKEQQLNREAARAEEEINEAITEFLEKVDNM